MKIVILDGHALNPGDLSWDCFRQLGAVSYYDRTETEADTIARIQDADIILLNKTPITHSVLDACPNLKLICILATGYNVADCDAAAKMGIPVCNVPGYSTDAVAQFTFALLLELCHQVGLHSRSVHDGDWSSCPDFCYWKTPQMELAGKTLGIIGYGSIGQSVGRIARKVPQTQPRGNADCIDILRQLPLHFWSNRKPSKVSANNSYATFYTKVSKCPLNFTKKVNKNTKKPKNFNF